jgi:DivIVA domain-containing protein
VPMSEPLEPEQTETEPSGTAEEGRGSIAVAAEIREVSFPASVRGYDRQAVDAYVARVNALIAELDVSGSPEAAVRHALAQVGEQTSSLLQQAGETAEEIIVGARQEADETTTRAQAEAKETIATAQAEAGEILERSKREAETTAAQSRTEAAERLQRSQEEVTALREEAEARLRELHDDTEGIRQQRRVLLDDLRGIAAKVAETASIAEARFQPGGPTESPEEETLDFERDAEGREADLGADARDDGLARR